MISHGLCTRSSGDTEAVGVGRLVRVAELACGTRLTFGVGVLRLCAWELDERTLFRFGKCFRGTDWRACPERNLRDRLEARRPI